MPHKSPDSEPETPWKLYIAAAVGSLTITLGDLISHPQTATAVRLSEQLFRWAPEEGGRWLALGLLTVLGVLLAWVHQPWTRGDAFARGLAVFAVLAVVSPTVENTGSLTSLGSDGGITLWASSVGVRGGVRYGFAGLRASVLQRQTLTRYSRIIRLNGVSPGSTSWITLRDRETGKVIVRQSVRSGLFRISQPPGAYQLDVEQNGYRRLTVPLDLSENDRAVSGLRLDMTRSKVPLGFQKLFSPRQIQGDTIPPSPALDAMIEALLSGTREWVRPPQPDSGTNEDSGRSPMSGSAVEVI